MKRIINSDIMVKQKIDEFNISLKHEESYSFGIPPCVKSSILITNKILDSGKNQIAIVFPEKDQCHFLYVIFKVLNDILENRIIRKYEPSKFAQGQKLSFNNCIVEFDKVDDKGYIWVNTMDKKNKCKIGLPSNIAPFFQPTDTLRPISKHIKYAQTMKEFNMPIDTNNYAGFMKILTNYKTHITSTFGLITTMYSTIEKLNDILICNIPIIDLIMIGQANLEGEVKNIGKGKLSGDPTIIMTPDLYSMKKVTEGISNVECIFIDINTYKEFENQLDSLDVLIKKNIPIICILDAPNSMEISSLISRKFLIHRWNKDIISSNLITPQNTFIDKKLQNIMSQQIHYHEIISNEFSECLSILYKNNKNIENEISNVYTTHKKLFNIFSKLIRLVVPLSMDDQKYLNSEIQLCEELLGNEKWHLSKDRFSDYERVIEIIRKFTEGCNSIGKIDPFIEILNNNAKNSTCIIVNNTRDQIATEGYLKNYYGSNFSNLRITILSYQDFVKKSKDFYDLILVCSWFNEKKMKSILFNYSANEYHILLYNIEVKWKDSHTKNWAYIQSIDNFDQDLEKVIYSKFNTLEDIRTDNIQQTQVTDDLEEMEFILDRVDYRRYQILKNNYPDNSIVQAVPVVFSGECFSFFGKTHKVISVTDILKEKADSVKMLYPGDLSENDIIVIRESEKDLIREIADSILNANYKKDTREKAGLWKSAIHESRLSFNSLHKKLIAYGCNKSEHTIRGWIENSDIIAPQDDADIIAIAKITNNTELNENIEDVILSASLVKAAHISAGRKLSKQLKKQIPAKLAEIGVVMVSEIWKPLDVYLEDIGNIKILKVKSIDNPVKVDVLHVNKIIYE